MSVRGGMSTGKLEMRDMRDGMSILVAQEGLTFGRDGGEARFGLGSGEISKQHARVFSRRGVWYVEDLRSTNGTFIDNERVSGPARLPVGAILSLGDRFFHVLQVVPEGQRPFTQVLTALPTEARHQDRAPPPSSLRLFGRAVLQIPRMVLLPTRAIELDAFPALTGRGLMVLALPAVLAWGLLPALAPVLPDLIAGAPDWSAAVPVVPLAVAFALAFAVCSLFHPVVRWTVSRLGGQSDSALRTNFAAGLFSIAAVLALPTVTMAGLMPLHLWSLPIVGPSLTLLASLTAIVVGHEWLEALGVSRSARLLTLAVATMACTGTVFELGAATTRAITEPANVTSLEVPLETLPAANR